MSCIHKEIVNYSVMAKTALEQIAELNSRIDELKTNAATELREKMVLVRKQLSGMEEQYAELTGGKASVKVRRPKVTDEELTAQLRGLLAEAGEEGMSGKAMADAVGQGYPRITKFLKDNPRAFKKQGTGKQTRYFLP